MNQRRTAALVTALLIVAAPAAAGGGGEGPYCDNAQSPRNVDPRTEPSPYQLTSHASFLGRTGDDAVVYLPRPGGAPQTLYRCGQHYHLPIENPQGCAGEDAGDAAQASHAAPPAGARVEIHTVYAANRDAPPDCDPETLACCTDPPFLVRAFSAAVTAGGEEGPIVPPAGRPLAEWSGSTTGPDREGEPCKPAALWSLRLGCGFTVSTAQLAAFKHADPPRPVQEGDRLSRDLTLVTP